VTLWEGQESVTITFSAFLLQQADQGTDLPPIGPEKCHTDYLLVHIHRAVLRAGPSGPRPEAQNQEVFQITTKTKNKHDHE